MRRPMGDLQGGGSKTTKEMIWIAFYILICIFNLIPYIIH